MVNGVCANHNRRVTPKPRSVAPLVGVAKPTLSEAFRRMADVLLDDVESDRVNDHIIEERIRECVAAMRLGRRIGRRVPPSAIAFSLQLATEDWEKAEAEARR